MCTTPSCDRGLHACTHMAIAACLLAHTWLLHAILAPHTRCMAWHAPTTHLQNAPGVSAWLPPLPRQLLTRPPPLGRGARDRSWQDRLPPAVAFRSSSSRPRRSRTRGWGPCRSGAAPCFEDPQTAEYAKLGAADATTQKTRRMLLLFYARCGNKCV